MPLYPKTRIHVRRHWNDQRIGVVHFEDLKKLRWDTVSGGVGRRSPRPMIYGYTSCDSFISGELSHSGTHGPCPHWIKVVVVAKDNVHLMKALTEMLPPKSDMTGLAHAEQVAPNVFRDPSGRFIARGPRGGTKRYKTLKGAQARVQKAWKSAS